jgi:ribosomal protein S27E
MHITCSKCKKVYNVNPNKIPSGLTSTKCNACGNSIPLPQSTPQTPPPGPAQAPPSPKSGFIKITCQYCSQQYNISPKAVREGVTSTKCRACGHTISLKTAATAPLKADPVKTAPQNTATKEITCLYCGKKYNINAAKIPPGMTTTKCKACGRPMSLMDGQSGIAAHKNDIGQDVIAPQQPYKGSTGNPPAADIPMFPDMGRPATPIFRKSWILAAAAAIIIILFAGNLLKTNWNQVTASRFGLNKIIGKKPAIHKKEPRARSMAAVEPLIAARLNVPLLLEAIDQNLPDEKKDIKYKMTARIFKSFGFGKIQLYLYPDPEHTFLPVILAASKDGKSLEKYLKSQNNFIQFLERESDGSYRINQKALPEDKRNHFPFDLYRIQFIDNSAVFAPEHLAQALKESEGLLRKTQVAQMIAAIARPRDLAVLSVKIPENFAPVWQENIQSNPALKQNPQAAMIAAMGGNVLAQLSEPLEGTEALAISFRLNNANGRVLSYAQQFRKDVNGKKIAEQLKSGDHDDLNVDGLALKLIALLNDPRYQHQIGHKNNRLTLELNWEQQHDKALLTSLSEATLGQIFAQSMDLAPSKGPVRTQYTEPPRLSAAVNVNNLKKTIPNAVRQSLLPGNYWNNGGQPRMTLDLDTIEVPNASLAQLTYEVLEVVTTDGKNVLRVEENKFQHKINPGSPSPGYIDVNVKKGTPAKALRTAKIRFQLSLPAGLAKLEFVCGNAPGSVRESNGVWVKLGRLEKDVAKVTYRGGASAQLFAFDKTGRALASKESMSSSSSVTTRFQGEIKTLMVVVVQKMFDYPFEVDVDLNKDKKLAYNFFNILKLV